MEKKVLNYRVIIEPEKMGRKVFYNAYCPTLGLADYGESIEEAFSRIQKLVKFHIESLIEDKQPIPFPDTEEGFISLAKVKVSVPTSISLR